MSQSSELVTIATLVVILVTTLMCLKLFFEAFFSPGVIPGLIALLLIDGFAIRYLFKEQ